MLKAYDEKKCSGKKVRVVCYRRGNCFSLGSDQVLFVVVQ